MGYSAQYGIADELGKLQAKYGKVTTAAYDILTDPALPQVADLVNKIKATEPPGKPGQKAGVGLKRLVPPLKMYLAYRKNPALGMMALVAVLAIPFTLGYILGKR